MIPLIVMTAALLQKQMIKILVFTWAWSFDQSLTDKIHHAIIITNSTRGDAPREPIFCEEARALSSQIRNKFQFIKFSQIIEDN